MKSKRGERRANKILDIIVGRVLSFFLVFRPMQLCSSPSYTSFDFAGSPPPSLPPLVLFPLLLFVVLVVEEARKNAPFLRISLGMLFIRIRVFFCPFFPSIFLL